MLQLCLKIAAIVFVVESTAMLILGWLKIDNEAFNDFGDAVFLVLVSSPLIYYLVVRPFVDRRDRAEEALLRAGRELEKRVEERTAALREAEAHSRLLLNSASSGILGLDTSGAAIFVNAAAVSMLGFHAEELIGRQAHAVIHHSRADGSPCPMDTCLMLAVLSDGVTRTANDEVLWCKDGTCFPVEYTSHAMVKEDRLAGAVVVFQDISQRHEAQEELKRSVVIEAARRQAEAANAAKSLFLANLSHEIRTPLNGVVANLELLALTETTPDQTELTASAAIAAEALSKVIDDVLDLSKIEAGKIAIEVIPMLARNVVHEVAMLIRSQAVSRNLDFACHIDGRATLPLAGDPTRLRQILMNLTGNALKFTETGGIFLNLFRVAAGSSPEAESSEGQSSEGQSSEDTAEFWFEIVDTGIGFAPERAEDLFEAFTQEHLSTMRRFGGSGLGLTICRSLTELMGGSIYAEGSIGGGASFWCRIPFPVIGEAGGIAPDISGLSVLLAVSDPILRRDLSRLLVAAGIRPAVTGGAAAAPRLIEEAAALEKPYDIVLAVLGEDEEAGFNLPAAIKGLPTVPVMLTALEAVGARRKGYVHGYRHCLTLPLDVPELTATLAEASGRAPSLLSTGGETVAHSLERLKAALLPMRSSRLLVIEDKPMNQMIARRQLKLLGFDCDVAENGRIGYEMAIKGEYSLIFCDIEMPEMDGYGFMRKFRQWEGANPPTPVVAMTANALDSDLQKCLECGMDDRLSKPVRIEGIGSVLLRMLPDAGKRDRLPALPDPVPLAVPEISPIDRGLLSELLGEDTDEAHCEVLSFFIKCFQPLLAQLSAAIAAKDQVKTVELAHAATGSAKSAAALTLGFHLGQIESIARGMHWSGIAALLVQAEEEFRRVETFVAVLKVPAEPAPESRSPESPYPESPSPESTAMISGQA